jgi:hypothetical protein
LEDEEDRLLIDATEVQIARPTKSWIQNITWSGYKKRNTVKYEVALSEKTGFPVHFSGPYSGATGDVSIFRDVLKQKMIEASYRGLADGTYQGEGDLLTVPPRGWRGDTEIKFNTRKALSH